MTSLPINLVTPQLKFTLFRLCGAPKLIFYASVTPPDHAKQTVVAPHAPRRASPGDAGGLNNA